MTKTNTEAVEALRPYLRHNSKCKLYANTVKYDCTCGLSKAIEAALSPAAKTEPSAEGELPCQECGGPNPAWFADDALWNLVMGGPDAKDDPGGILCPTCFIAKAGETLRITKTEPSVAGLGDCPPHCCCCGPYEPCCDCGEVRPSACCLGEKCWCGAPAAKKVGEEILPDDPNPNRHNLTRYVCARHYAQLMGPAGAKQVGIEDAALSAPTRERELLRCARDVFNKLYVDWDGEPEDIYDAYAMRNRIDNLLNEGKADG